MKVWGKKSESPAMVEVARAANQGLPRPELLRKTLAALAGDGRSDRIGVWLESGPDSGSASFAEYAAASFRGMVWDRDSEDIPLEWQHLSPQAPLPQELLTAGRSVEFDEDAVPMIGPLLELRRAVLVPVGHSGRLRGVLLAGSRQKHGAIATALFESAAAELALAMELDEEQQRSASHHADLRIVKQVLADLSATRQPGQILAELVCGCAAGSASPGGLNARFAAVGYLAGNPRIESGGSQNFKPGNPGAGFREISGAPVVDFLWKSGDTLWSNVLECSPIAEIWQQALAERRTAGGNSYPHLANDREAHHSSSFSVCTPASSRLHISAIPLESDGHLIGVLVAGLALPCATPAALERLELRAALAATVLAGWKRGNEETRLAAWRKSLLDNNTQATVLLDDEGEITGMSAAACRLLEELPAESLRGPAPENREMTGPAGEHPLRGGQRLMHLFQDADQLRIAAWSARALAGSSDRRGEPRHGPAELPEAILSNGVRVRLRPALPAGGRFAAVTLEKLEVTLPAPHSSRAESELTSVLEWLDEGVILFDAQDRVRALNSRFLQITGLPAADAAGLLDLDSLISTLLPRLAGPSNFAQRWRNLARGIDGGIREELEFVGPSPRIVQRMSRPILDGHGRRLGRVEIYLDLSGRRGFQSKLLRTEKLAALGQLVTGIAHELSSPLTSILGYSQVLLQKEAGGPSEEISQVRHIFEEAERATAILRQLLSNAHERKPELGAVPINQLVLQGLELQRLSLAQEHIRVETDLDPSGPLVYGDQGQLQQVFLNLMGNARQALDQSGKHGHIRIRTKQIGDQRVLLEIADDGPGIPQEIMARIFDPFFTTKPAGIGTGLGLAIVSGIVREHGGHVNVASPPGGGAIFSVALMAAGPSSAGNSAYHAGERSLLGYVGGAPARFPAADLSVRRHQPSAVQELSGKRGHRILVVEDEPTVARLIADVLEDEGFRVDVLLDGQEALKQAARETYDLVICDMKMPGLDGQHFYKALVQSGNALSKRFLFVTGDIVAQQTQQFLEAHRLPHVAKPFRMEELKDQVYAVLSHNLHRQPDAAGAAKNV